MFKNIIVGCIGAFGFLLILGVAGSDCGGSCMEDAMSLDKMMIYGAIGTIMIAFSVYFLNKRP
jgi:hypothetical protein|tara:strand:- start:6190 stop:6378 length:189 start_codon:yes stop_codon:yes gene_type:complete